MPDRISFVVEGPPVAKARARSGQGIFYTPAKTKAYEQAVAWSARKAMRGHELFDGAVELSLMVHISVPKSWPNKKKDQAAMGFIRPTARPDLDNYLKIVCDGLNGIVWKDDAQVVRVEASKLYEDWQGKPRIEVMVSSVVSVKSKAA